MSAEWSGNRFSTLHNLSNFEKNFRFSARVPVTNFIINMLLVGVMMEEGKVVPVKQNFCLTFYTFSFFYCFFSSESLLPSLLVSRRLVIGIYFEVGNASNSS